MDATLESNLHRSMGDKMKILHHYTSEDGHAGIMQSKTLRASLKANNPKDARFGDGQYLSDIPLAIVALPSVDEIARQIEFEARSISANEFEAVWKRTAA